ncbi:MAG: hypothetical protein A2V69_00860 [Candidatus Portnoybacteria bacterium RBG_13_40_8]|uniref:Uncharacterized protein n=1 Tax=Candidatus Portnoybacteria bacterium RBG_13_40_8 TaxID=1801990 RepID=A0A1G2F4U1_9BACT|nr:MAG: hypothetical protein A2V69_00860 [Candidatus Portnoybacteria bacterium RBG_13_40_8]OGZ35468.1 MAG: hypothetical protein A2V60_03465 [Candidatus Portnoybacteria bacterium RIFCSPHIGHO2_01_FULL_39_19]
MLSKTLEKIKGFPKNKQGQRSKIVITNLLKTLQNPEFIQELRWKLEMVRGLKQLKLDIEDKKRKSLTELPHELRGSVLKND